VQEKRKKREEEARIYQEIKRMNESPNAEAEKG